MSLLIELLRMLFGPWSSERSTLHVRGYSRGGRRSGNVRNHFRSHRRRR